MNSKRLLAQIVRPETILGWHRKLIARKFDGSKQRVRPTRPNRRLRIDELVVRMDREHRSWAYRRIMGALANLGYELSHQAVADNPQRQGLPPAPESNKGMQWRDLISQRLGCHPEVRT